MRRKAPSSPPRAASRSSCSWLVDSDETAIVTRIDGLEGQNSSPDFSALLTVHVFDRLARDQPGDPVDQPHAVDLQLVEPRPFEDPVAVAGRGVTVQRDTGPFDR